MKLALDVEIEVKVTEGGAEKETIVIFLREFTAKEQKDRKALIDKFNALFKKAQKLEKKQRRHEKSIDLLEAAGRPEDALIKVKESEKLDADLEAISKELENLGGNDFAETEARKRFDALVGGNGKEKLRSYAEIKGYVTVMRLLDVEKAAIEKKQSGE
jgi:hypothetical protein